MFSQGLGKKISLNYLAFDKKFAFVYFLITLASIFIYSLFKSIDIPTFHLDGAFQAASGLYRLSSGQLPGQDFNPYLGTDLLFILYPFFYLLGKNISASVFAAHFVIAICFFCKIFIVSILISNFKKVHISLTIAASLTIAILFFSHYSLDSVPDILNNQFIPGNSLRPLRSFLPYIVSFVTYFIFYSNTNISGRNQYITLGILASFCLFWSPDYAYSSLFGLITFSFIWILYAKNPYKNLFFMIISFLVALNILSFFFTNGNLLELFKYNFLAVARDQYWYFGPWSEDYKILGIQDLFLKLIPCFGLFLVVLFFYFYLCIKKPNLNHFALFLLGINLFMGGAISIYYGHIDSYAEPYIFWAILVITLFFLFKFYNQVRQIFLKIFSRLINIKFILILISSLLLFYLVIDYSSSITFAKIDNKRFYVSELGGFLPISYKNYVSDARAAKNDRVIEEYWGIWSAINRRNDSFKVDSIIHALGNYRSFYRSELIKNPPSRFITTRYAASPEWQPWNLSANYWFYKILLQDYIAVVSSPKTLTWYKRASKLHKDPVNCNFFQDKFYIKANRTPSYYEIHLETIGKLSDRNILKVKTNVNRAYSSDGFLALSKENYQEFPVAALEKNSVFNLVGFARFKDNINITSCKAFELNLDSDALALKETKPDNIPMDLTNKDWLNGVSRSSAIFFVPLTSSNLKYFSVNKKIKFSDGDIRKIIKIDTNDNLYLNVYTDGKKLDGNIVGYPNEFILYK
jgi:hypothetical protein